jgi:hypothetical protein
MNMPKGGRGVKAPYETVVIRVPKPIESDILEIIQSYRDGSQKPVTSNLDKDKMIELAKSILSEKKSAKISLTKLLQVLLEDKEINL